MYDGEVTALEPQEKRELLDAAAGATFRKELTVRALLETGLRAGELAHIKPHWFLEDRNPPAIQVPPHEPCDCSRCAERAKRNLRRWCKAELRDQGEMERRPDVGSERYEELLEGRVGDMWKPKSDSGERKVPVGDDWVWENLRDHVEAHDGFSAGRHGIWYRVRQAAEPLDLPKPVTPHVLRHTYGTELIRGGMKIAQLKELMGHESVESTQVYLHPTYEDLGTAYREARRNNGVGARE